MTKFSDIDEPSRSSHIRYVDELWDYHRDMRFESLNRITGYLFILNSGALLATLTYVASKGANGCIVVSIWLFAAGILASILHAAIDYYVSDFSLSKYTKSVENLYQDKIEWEAFMGEVNNPEQISDIVLQALGWIGAGLFIAGVCVGIPQIPLVAT